MPGDLQRTIQQITMGNQAAFRRLVEEYQQKAFRLSFRILCDEEEARDAVQDSFIKIWSKISTFDHRQQFNAWIYKIFTHTALDRLRSIKRRSRVNLEEVYRSVETIHTSNPDGELDNQEISGLIRALANGLSEKQQVVFVLRDIEGLSSAEVQEIMDMNETSVKSNLYHARRTIRKKLLNLLTYERRIR